MCVVMESSQRYGLPLDEIKRVFRTLVEAVATMHTLRLVHRDIKLEVNSLYCFTSERNPNRSGGVVYSCMEGEHSDSVGT